MFHVGERLLGPAIDAVSGSISQLYSSVISFLTVGFGDQNETVNPLHGDAPRPEMIAVELDPETGGSSVIDISEVGGTVVVPEDISIDLESASLRPDSFVSVSEERLTALSDQWSTVMNSIHFSVESYGDTDSFTAALPDGFNLVSSFHPSGGEPGLDGYLVIDESHNNDIHLVFRGSDRRDMADNGFGLSRIQENWSSSGRMPFHEGRDGSPQVSNYFGGDWADARGEVMADLRSAIDTGNSAQRIIISGHSMGGVMGDYALYEIMDQSNSGAFEGVDLNRVTLNTFGAPGVVGEHSFDRSFSEGVASNGVTHNQFQIGPRMTGGRSVDGIPDRGSSALQIDFSMSLNRNSIVQIAPRPVAGGGDPHMYTHYQSLLGRASE
jgi:hypothetical protein